jgi:DNA polymerase (family 10)
VTIRYPYALAIRVAEAVVDELRPACRRIEIAGSLRRRRDTVHDIDLVVIPRLVRAPAPQVGLFENDLVEASALDARLAELRDDDRIVDLNLANKVHRCVAAKSGIPIDIYVATPESWGTTLMVRTGSKEHNIEMCQRARNRGLILKADGQGLIDATTKKAAGVFREEVALFKFLGLRPIDPHDREVGIEREGIAL